MEDKAGNCRSKVLEQARECAIKFISRGSGHHNKKKTEVMAT